MTTLMIIAAFVLGVWLTELCAIWDEEDEKEAGYGR
jgi:hypothetical protein